MSLIFPDGSRTMAYDQYGQPPAQYAPPAYGNQPNYGGQQWASPQDPTFSPGQDYTGLIGTRHPHRRYGLQQAAQQAAYQQPPRPYGGRPSAGPQQHGGMYGGKPAAAPQRQPYGMMRPSSPPSPFGIRPSGGFR